MRQELVLKAPLSGVIYPIEQVPDPVFSQKMVGDGLSIDPTSHTLYAPIDGIVTQLHSAKHAVTLTHSSGLEVMIHIGLDTVALKSKGFKTYIQEGQQVQAGETLIDFDMDYLATHARSLMTQVILVNGEMIDTLEKSYGFAQCNESTLLRVTLTEKPAHNNNENAKEEDEEVLISKAVAISNPAGLHARPAAILAMTAKNYDAVLTLHKGETSANAKSIIGIMGLDIHYQDEIRLAAKGSDAQEAIAEIIPLIQSGLGEEVSETSASPRISEIEKDQGPIPTPKSGDADLLAGIAASPGIAIGTAVQIGRELFNFEEEAPDSEAEKIRLSKAIRESEKQLKKLQSRLQEQAKDAKAAIFAAHQELLEDPELIEIAKSMIDKGKSAEYGWQYAFTLYAKQLEALKNRLLAERANDLRDVGKRVMRVLTGQTPKSLELPDNAILLADELAPSFIANIDTSKVKGFCVTTGGATSHVAIIARSMDIPAIAGIEAQALDIPDGEILILDGNTGMLRVHPPKAVIEETRKKQHKLLEERTENLKSASLPATTTDGKQIEVVANIASLKEAVESVKLGGEGVGLLRSEFLFLNRDTEPTEEEQYEIYRDILLALEGRPLLIRTLDVGGDKPLDYLPLPAEENPFLGLRGIRISLEKPELFRVQARAILRTGVHGKVRIMFPMISTIDEIREVKSILEEEHKKLGVDPIETGIMVEVPSAALMADQLAKEVDFFSIGTNDLAQYTLAIDRGHPKLAAKIDALDPAVLRLVKFTAEGAHQEGKWVGICGGLASDPQATPILIGLGIDELSVTVPAIPQIKAEIRKYASATCREIAQKALNCASAAEVRALLEKAGGER